MDIEARKTPPPQEPTASMAKDQRTTPTRRTNLNPDSPAYIPSFNPSASSPRVDAPEFTPPKPDFPPNRLSVLSDNNNSGWRDFNPLRKPTHPTAASRAMEGRLWRSEDLSDEFTLFNHWLLYSRDRYGSVRSPEKGKHLRLNGLDQSSYSSIPDLNGYCDLLPMDGAGDFDVSFCIPSCTKVIPGLQFKTLRGRKAITDRLYTLVIVQNIVINDNSVFAPFEAYRRFQSPFALRLIEAFTTHQNAGKPELVVVYENYPGAVRLGEHLKAARPDEYMRHIACWVAQLVYMLWTVHQADLALDEMLRVESLILPPSQQKIVFCGMGLMDLLITASAARLGPSQGNLSDRQAKDYENLRKIIDYLLALLPSRSESALKINKWLTDLPPIWHYSRADLGQALLKCRLDEMIVLGLNKRVNFLEHELAKQLENDRLFRIMTKFCFINERQSFAHDQNWSETGNRYVLKLFRDYVFHCQDEAGAAIIDFAHVIDCLNKLDAASDEIIMLASRKGDQCIFASYADIRSRLDATFEQLLQGS